MKFGRRRPRAHCPHLKLARYLPSELVAPPDACSYSAKAASLAELYGNDQLGDCVIAAGYHVVGVETGNADKPFVASADQIVADYSAIGGYVPGDASTDQGCDEQTALNYWTQTGFADGTKLAGWAAVDATNPAQVKQAMYLFENLFFGIELPDPWVTPFPSAPGFVWDVATPNPDNGHAVMGTGYDEVGVQICTWAMLGTITWEAVAALCTPSAGGMLYVLLTPDQLARGQDKAPNGVSWAQLLSDLAAMGGTAPQPLPAPAPTLDQAITWATQGLLENWPQGSP